MTDIDVRSGTLIAHRLFDVADTIDLAAAEAAWAAHAGLRGRRTALQTASPNELAYEVPPIELALPPREVLIDGTPHPASWSARLYDFGAITLALRVDASELAWHDFATRCNALDRAIGTRSHTTVWEEVLDALLAVIASSLRKPASQRLEEDYLFAVVNAFAEPLTADEIQSRFDLPALLTGETRQLSRQERREVTAQSFSYLEDDLVVLTWDRAFLHEPRGDSEVLNILEVANAQLLEMRHYDEMLDDELSTMYGLVDSAHGSLSLLASRRAARLARRLHGVVAEVTGLTERVENSLQVTEDVYLARVYEAALNAFRVPKLSSAVERKLAIIRDTYETLYAEASSRRAELLELAIVLLIVFEIVLALMGH